jgi:hypothetical protein
MKLSTLLESTHKFDSIKETCRYAGCKEAQREFFQELRSIPGCSVSPEQEKDSINRSNKGLFGYMFWYIFTYKGHEMNLKMAYFHSRYSPNRMTERWKSGECYAVVPKGHFLFDLHDDPKVLDHYKHKKRIPEDSTKHYVSLGEHESNFEHYSAIEGVIKKLYKKIQQFQES